MSEPSFRHLVSPVRVFSGQSALEALPRELARLGANRAVLFCGASMASTHSAQLLRVENVVGERLAARFDEVRADSPLDVVERAARLLRETVADAAIAVGGGSAVVTARAASILAAEGRPVRELATHRDASGAMVSPRLEAAKLPHLVVATSPTTAYAKAGSAVRDPETGERLAMFDPKTRAGSLFFDGGLAGTSPESMVAAAALDALSLAVEGLQSEADDPLADALLMHALRLVVDWLPRLGGTDDGEARLRLMLAALMAGQGSDHVGTGLSQPLAHALGPRSAVGNGLVEAILLPATIAHNASFVGDRLMAVMAALGDGGPAEAPREQRAARAIEELLERCGLPRRLRDVGLVEEDLSEAVVHALDDWAITRAPRAAGREELAAVLRRAW